MLRPWTRQRVVPSMARHGGHAGEGRIVLARRRGVDAWSGVPRCRGLRGRAGRRWWTRRGRCGRGASGIGGGAGELAPGEPNDPPPPDIPPPPPTPPPPPLVEPAVCWTGAAAAGSVGGARGVGGGAVAAAGDIVGCWAACAGPRLLATWSAGAFSPPAPGPPAAPPWLARSWRRSPRRTWLENRTGSWALRPRGRCPSTAPAMRATRPTIRRWMELKVNPRRLRLCWVRWATSGARVSGLLQTAGPKSWPARHELRCFHEVAGVLLHRGSR